jgi:uncharacterized protein YxjI
LASFLFWKGKGLIMSLEKLTRPENQHLVIKQKFEMAELFGFETRNKYAIYNEQKDLLFYCAEEKKGVFGHLMRHFFGHWRRFNLHLYNESKQQIATAKQPFRFFFQEMQVVSAEGRVLLRMEQRFSFINKAFDFYDGAGTKIYETRSPFWRIWTFPIKKHDTNEEVAVISKKWGGVLSEFFTDKDQFHLSFKDPHLAKEHKLGLVIAAIFVDLNYFEEKASR